MKRNLLNILEEPQNNLGQNCSKVGGMDKNGEDGQRTQELLKSSVVSKEYLTTLKIGLAKNLEESLRMLKEC